MQDNNFANIIDIENISFFYKAENFVLKDINFSIKKGDFVAVIGASGSGKSTIINLCNGSLTSKTGLVKINNLNIQDMSRLQRANLIATVPQEIDKNIPFTVQEIVSFSRMNKYSRFKKMPESQREIVDNSLKITDIFHKRNSIFSTLSGGEKQRVLIASALALEPQILFLDEPTSSLDIGHNMKIMNTLQKLNDDGMTIIISTHNLTNLIDFANRVIALKKGEIFADACTKDILKKEILTEVFEYKFENINKFC
ncbi:ABC transporter ATP-binding protein [Lentisphaerota bacterium WC36G]|nr:ABC transporter ATP-binding protein [Lentisphaerae bacterium WC36]